MDSVVAFPAAPAAPATGAGRARPGYDPDAEATARRVGPMLDAERVAWLSTVRPDGLPHLVPTWFWWDGEALLVWSKPDAVKVRNLRANPGLMVALGDPAADFSVALIEARATLVAAPIPDAFFAKYRDDLAAAGLDEAGFRATFRQGLRIAPTRFLAWHGRGARHGFAPGPATPAATRSAIPARRTAGALDRMAEGLRGVLEAAAARLRPRVVGHASSPA
jgi:PPOX class probable F420-dependent enzyme